MVHSKSIYFFRRHHCKGIMNIFTICLSGLWLYGMLPFRSDWFTGIGPPTINSMTCKLLFYLLPVKLPTLFFKRIVNLCSREKQFLFCKFFIICCDTAHIWPDRKHKVNSFFMQCFYHSRRIWKSVGIKSFLSPLSVWPRHPVQDKTIHSNITSLEFIRNCQNFFFTFIAFLRLNIAICPFRKHSRLPCDLPIIPNYLKHITSTQKIIIQVPVRFRL